MKQLTIILTSVMLALLGASAFAASTNDLSPRFYMGLQGGYNDMDVDTGSATGQDIFGRTVTVTAKKDQSYSNIHAGVIIPVNENVAWGGQFGYSYYGAYKASISTRGTNFLNDSSAEADISSLNTQFLLRLTQNNFYIQGQAGVGYFLSMESGNIAMNGVTMPVQDEERFLPIAGVNLGYNINDHFSVYLSYNHVFGTDFTTNDVNSDSDSMPSMNNFGLGVNYTF